MIPAELSGPVIEPSDPSSTARLDTYVFFTPIAVGRGTAFMPCALFGVLYANAPDESYFLALPQCPFVAAPSTFGYPVSHGVQIRSTHQCNPGKIEPKTHPSRSVEILSCRTHAERLFSCSFRSKQRTCTKNSRYVRC